MALLIETIHSCQQLLTQDAPGPQDAHGCPFRHFSIQSLTIALQNLCGITDVKVQKEILESVKANHYHVACTRVFEVTHSRARGEGLGNGGESVVHPNAYFERSVKLKAELAEGIKSSSDVKKEAKGSDEMV